MNEEPELFEAKTRMRDDVLLKIVNADHEKHNQLDIDFAKAELVRRGFKLIRTGGDFHVITPQGVELTPEKIPSGRLHGAPPTSPPATAQTDASDNAPTGLNWSRILKYTLLMIIVTFVVGFFFGVITSFYTRAGGNATEFSTKIFGNLPYWLQVTQSIAAMGGVILVFALLSYKQRERTLIHVLIVGLISWLIGLVNILFGQPLIEWAGGVLFILIAMIISIPIGLGLRVRKEMAQYKVSPIHQG